MPTTRQFKIATQISRVLAQACQQTLNDPRLARIVIKETRVSKDFSYAIVFFSSLNHADSEETLLKALKKATPLLRHLIATQMKLRIVPKLDFRYDEVEAEAQHIDELLRKALNPDEA